jgi:hypothetical protein
MPAINERDFYMLVLKNINKRPVVHLAALELEDKGLDMSSKCYIFYANVYIVLESLFGHLCQLSNSSALYRRG